MIISGLSTVDSASQRSVSVQEAVDYFNTCGLSVSVLASVPTATSAVSQLPSSHLFDDKPTGLQLSTPVCARTDFTKTRIMWKMETFNSILNCTVLFVCGCEVICRISFKRGLRRQGLN